MVHIDWSAVITQVLVVLLPLLVASGVAYLSALASREWKYFKQKYPDVAGAIEEYAPVAVAAAEQLRISGALPSGADAKTYAIKAVQTYLDVHGLKGVNVALIENAVEAEVLKLPPTTPQLPVPKPVG